MARQIAPVPQDLGIDSITSEENISPGPFAHPITVSSATTAQSEYLPLLTGTVITYFSKREIHLQPAIGLDRETTTSGAYQEYTFTSVLHGS